MNSSYSGTNFGAEQPRVVVLKMIYQFMINYNYLIVDPISRQAVIVDPAWQMEKIENALMETQAELKGILLTHAHPDHIHLAKPLAAKHNCPIWMSKKEITSSGFNAEQLIGIDEMSWSIGQMQIQPILTPGHTPGCICYRIGDNLFTGDVLFAEGCGICPDTQSAYQMYDSLSNLKKTLDPQTRIFPGHSYGKIPGRVFSKILKENIYLQFNDQTSFAAFRLRSGQSKNKLLSFS